MDDPLRGPRCECCDEVLEELLSMRQNFEKYFQRFNTQIVQMRRELNSLMTEKQKESNSHGTNNINNILPRAVGKRKKPNTSNSSARKTTRYEHSTEDDDDDNDDREIMATSSTMANNRKSKSSIKSNNSRSPMANFLGIRLRVMPTCPFKTDVEFEEWDRLLANDPDQRDRLRGELLQGKFDDHDKFVKHIWRSVLVDEVAQRYTYRGNIKADKKAIKDYSFTAIFRDSFMERYADLDAIFFMERTMRFFNYAHDRLRRISKGQKQFESMQIRVENSEEHTVDSFIKVLNESEDVFAEDIEKNE